MPTPDDIDRAVLARVAAAAAGVGSLEVSQWRMTSVHDAFNETTKRLLRVNGTGLVADEVVDWSAILKVIGPATGTEAWDREAVVYGSGALRDLAGISAPRCFSIERREEPEAWVWLEDLGAPASTSWSLARYEDAARRLGVFNGTSATDHLESGAVVPPAPMRQFTDPSAAAFARLAAIRDHELVRRCWRDGLVDRVIRLWDERSLVLEELERLPQAFCHLDAFPANLLRRAGSQDLAAVDWSYSGTAPVGAELGPLVVASACMGQADAEALPVLEQACVPAYLEGLRAAGWRSDESVVRLGYTASVATRYGLFPMGVLLADDTVRPRFERHFGLPAPAIADRWATIAAFLLDRADEARRLLAAGVVT